MIDGAKKKYGSILEEIENDPVASREMAAARLSLEALSVLGHALSKSGMTQKNLSEKLGVTESAVSQVLFGDGNLRIYTFARYLRALGFEASLELKSEGVAIPKQVPRPRLSKGAAVVSFHPAEPTLGSAFDIIETSNAIDDSLPGNVIAGENQPIVETHQAGDVFEVLITERVPDVSSRSLGASNSDMELAA